MNQPLEAHTQAIGLSLYTIRQWDSESISDRLWDLLGFTECQDVQFHPQAGVVSYEEALVMVRNVAKERGLSIGRLN